MHVNKRIESIETVMFYPLPGVHRAGKGEQFWASSRFPVNDPMASTGVLKCPDQTLRTGGSGARTVCHMVTVEDERFYGSSIRVSK